MTISPVPNFSAAFTISKSTFDDNAADHGDEDGGAVYMDSDSPFMVTGSSFNDNEGADGAGINDDESTAETISGSSFDDNQGEDGALYVDNHAATSNVLTGDEFDGNRMSGNRRWPVRFLQARRFATQSAEVIELGAAHLGRAHDF